MVLDNLEVRFLPYKFICASYDVLFFHLHVLFSNVIAMALDLNSNQRHKMI